MPNLRRGMMAAAGADAGGPATYQLWSWGSDGQGRLGLGNIGSGSISSPQQIGTDFMGTLDVADEGIITTGNRLFTDFDASAAVKGDGTLWTWGYNNLGQLGIGDTTVRSSPVQVGSLTDWRSICMVQQAMCATKTDGTLWGWGYGSTTTPRCSGQTSNVSSPVQIGSDTDWGGVLATNVSLDTSILGIKTTGQLYMWGSVGGDGAYWSQGVISAAGYSVLPVAVDDKNYVMASCSRDCVWAVDNTGKLWSWGKNNYGQLGLGDKVFRSSPSQVGSATDWTWVSGDYTGEIFLGAKDNGEIWTSGRNDTGLMGLESITSYCSPVQVGGPGNWQSGGHGLAQGTAHAITDAKGNNTGGALWCLGGSGTSGVKGDGTTTTVSSPVQIGSDTTWVALTKQGTYSSDTKLAIKKA